MMRGNFELDIFKYFEYFKQKKVRLFHITHLMNIMKYRIKCRAMGMNLSKRLKIEPDKFGQGDSGAELYVFLKMLNVKNTDSVLDIGSGKGGAVISLSKYPFKKIDGVEIYESVCKIAERNILRTKYKNIKIYCEDARDFGGYGNYNMFYMCNPFSDSIMVDVLKRINESVVENPRDIVLIYINPLYHDVVLKSGMFVKYIDPNIFGLDVRIYSNNKNFRLLYNKGEV
jgi:SAM-dependent methyltransferase